MDLQSEIAWTSLPDPALLPDPDSSNSTYLPHTGASLFHGNHTEHSLPVESQRILIALYTITTFLAVFGNLLVIILFVVGRRARTDLRSFLANLALSDLVMAVFCMPFTFTYTMLHEWVFSAVMCTLVLFMQTVSVTASVGTSTVIAIDRYLVVARPLQSRNRRCRARFAIAAIWTLAGALCSVQLVIGRMEVVQVAPGVGVTLCVEAWPEPNRTWRTAYTYFIFLQTYLFPLCVIGFTYALIGRKLWRRKTPGNADETRDYNQLKSKRKVIKMLVIVVALFAVCWLPLHVFTLFMDYNPDMDNESQAEASSAGTAVFTTVHWLAMSNSFVNSIVYGFLNDSFRADVRWLFWRCLRCLPFVRRLAADSAKADLSDINHPRHTSAAYTIVRQQDGHGTYAIRQQDGLGTSMGRHRVRMESLQPPSSRRKSSLTNLGLGQALQDESSFSSSTFDPKQTSAGPQSDMASSKSMTSQGELLGTNCVMELRSDKPDDDNVRTDDTDDDKVDDTISDKVDIIISDKVDDIISDKADNNHRLTQVDVIHRDILVNKTSEAKKEMR